MELVTQPLYTPKVPPGSREVHVVFIPNRGGPLRASMRAPASGQNRRKVLTVAASAALPNVVTFPLAPTLADQQVEIGVHTLADSPTLAYFVFARGPNEARVMAPQGDVCPGPGVEAESEDVAADAATLVLTPGDYGQALADSLAGEPQPIRSYREFFTQLEAVSNPALLPPGSTAAQQVEAVMPTLRRRARARAVLHRHDPATAREPLLRRPTDALKGFVAPLSKLQLDLIGRVFTPRGMKFDLGAFEQAFELFANGDLRRKVTPRRFTKIHYWITQPSSAFQVFFAEFAFLAIECGLDASRWLEFANVLTRSQEIYFRAYPPKSVRTAGFPNYRACNYCEATKMKPQQIAALKVHMNGASLADLYGFAGDRAGRFMTKFAQP